ncbi:hypothetical protein [Bacillus sp. OAE603]|uniref:hypothetical protein n=1 Tax=Gottfriedia sp. OAE603 TaxID=2663872 RepID=UPI00178BFAE2
MGLFNQFHEIADDIEALRFKLNEFEIEYKFLLRNLEINKTKIKKTLKYYNKDRAAGGPVPNSLEELVFKRG